MLRMPEKGKSRDEVYAMLESYGTHDLPWREGGTFAYVYTTDPDMEEVIKYAYMRYLTENSLDPTVYPSLLQFEVEVVAMAAAHLGGDEDVVGNFTSGGTESCLLACKTARDYFRDKKPGIQPELVLPVTAHAAFQKACHYFDIKPVLVPVNTETFKVEPEAMRAAITDNTIMMVASACQYAHGVVDPIPELGRIAIEKDVLLHVDGCIGGFLLPYFRRLGRQITDFDFTVPGVTSMSMDFHKYAYAAKGASVVLYKNKDLRRYQIYTCSQWTGYTVINPTIQSTKSGGPLASCWALIQYLGDEGYLRLAKRTLDGTNRIMEGVKAIPGLRLLGDPELCLVAFTADDFSVFPIVDEMRKRGWFVQPQLGFHGSKENIHLSIDQATIDKADTFLQDLRETVEVVRAMPQPEGMDNLMRMLRDLKPEDFTPEVFAELMQASGIVDGGLPEGTAGINQVLNTVPAELSAKILTEFFNDLYAHRGGQQPDPKA